MDIVKVNKVKLTEPSKSVHQYTKMAIDILKMFIHNHNVMFILEFKVMGVCRGWKIDEARQNWNNTEQKIIWKTESVL